MNDNTDKEILKVIGVNFKEARSKSGLSQRKLAAMAGVEYNQVQKIEKGESNIQITTLLKLLFALNVTPNDILPTQAI